MGNLPSASDDHGRKTAETQSSVPIIAEEKPTNEHMDEHMVYAKDLNITWRLDKRYWKLVGENDTSESKFAELLNVCWLEVGGQLGTENLSRGTQYEVVFKVKMKPKAYGWDADVNFKFTPPDDTNPIIKKINLANILKDRVDQWEDIKFGEFKAPKNPGNIEFSLYELGGNWKSGLVIMGVAVRPPTGSSKTTEASDDHGKETEDTQPLFSGDGPEKKCTVYAKGLDIIWKDDPRYWQWVPNSDNHLVAELLNITWLDVSQQLGTKELSPGTLYEVVFVVKMKTKAYGWDADVKFKFTRPYDKNPKITKKNLANISKDQWEEIKIGDFKAPENPGNIKFSLYEYGGKWKSGLVIKGVEVRPPTDIRSAPSSKPAEASDDHGKETEEARLLFFGDGSEIQCMVYAKGLDITSSDDPRYWQWVPSDNHSVAELFSILSLDVRGQLGTEELLRGTLYEVVFVVKMKTEAYGWDAAQNFEFIPPDGTNPTIKKIKLAEELKDSKDQWKDIKIGEFKAPENPGKIKFSLYEHGGKRKSGLVIKGVAVRPTDIPSAPSSKPAEASDDHGKETEEARLVK